MAIALVRAPKVMTLVCASLWLVVPALAPATGPRRPDDPLSFLSAASRALPDPPTQTLPPQSATIAPGLVVRYSTGEFDVPTQTWTFRNGVVATYDLTTLHADSLIVHIAPGEESAQASGHIEMDDPAGLVTADTLNFSWLLSNRRATAQRVMIHIANVMLEAARAEMTPTRWDLYDVNASNCRENPPLFSVHASHLTIHPGSDGVIRKPSLSVLGVHVLTLPDQAFSLNSRTQGLQYPSLSYHAGQGFGISFKEGVLVSPTMNLAGTYGAIHGSLPGYGAVLTDSLLPEARTQSILTPSSDFSERFRYGYMENIEVTSPSQEARYLANSRSSLSLATAWNSFLVDRPDTIAYSKPIEGIYEYGGHTNGIGFLTQTRLQTIQEYGEELHDRVVLVGSAGLDPHRIAGSIRSLLRLDTEQFVGNGFGWARGIAGILYSPIPQVNLAVAGFASTSYGHPLYPIDELYAKNGYVIRGDLDLGPTRASYMLKWDSGLGWFDREYEIRQAVGCLEPFLIVRQFPRSYDLGIRIRLDDFYDVLRRRRFERPPAPIVVSQM